MFGEDVGGRADFCSIVRDMAGLERFLDRTRRYFEWFMRELNGKSMTPLQIKQLLS